MKILVAAAAGLLATAATAFAIGEPIAYGEAELGKLRVVSGVVVDEKLVELKGAWFDDSVPCTAKRKLKVTVSLTFSAAVGSGPPTMVKRSGTFSSLNCAEGGPNVGFTLKPASAKADCPDGSWKPGQYAFNTETTDVVKKLTAHASLLWLTETAC